MRLCYSDPVLVFATISTLPYTSTATPLLLRPPSSPFGTPRATYLTIIYVSIYDRSFDEPSESFSSPAYDSRSQPTLLQPHSHSIQPLEPNTTSGASNTVLGIYDGTVLPTCRIIPCNHAGSGSLRTAEDGALA